MSIDKYSESPSFSIQGGSGYPSICGALVSLIVLAVVIPYGSNKFFIMRDYKDTTFQSITEANAIDAREEFGFE